MERKLTAILSADVKGYSRLMGENEEATVHTLTTYREEMATIIRQHRGRVGVSLCCTASTNKYIRNACCLCDQATKPQ